jgi:tight adherence protein B
LSVALPTPLRLRAVLGRFRRPRQLAAMLGAYHLSPAPPHSGDPKARSQTLLTVPLLAALASRLGALADRLGAGERLRRALERAGARFKAADALTAWLLGTIMLGGLGWAVAGPVGAAGVLALAVAAPLMALQVCTDRRARLFAEQLPDVLKLTASSLRAGFSLLQGLEAVTRQLQEPCASEMQRVLSEARLGRPVEDALEAAAARIANPDFSESVAAVRVQQEAGGNLASLFDTLAGTMLERLRLRREVRSLTAEARLSAYVLGAMPIALAAFLFAVDRPYILELFKTKPGEAAVLVAFALQLIGFFWMYRTVKVDR